MDKIKVEHVRVCTKDSKIRISGFDYKWVEYKITINPDEAFRLSKVLMNAGDVDDEFIDGDDFGNFVVYKDADSISIVPKGEGFYYSIHNSEAELLGMAIQKCVVNSYIIKKLRLKGETVWTVYISCYDTIQEYQCDDFKEDPTLPMNGYCNVFDDKNNALNFVKQRIRELVRRSESDSYWACVDPEIVAEKCVENPSIGAHGDIRWWNGYGTNCKFIVCLKKDTIRE